MKIYQNDFRNIKEISKYLKETINNVDKHTDSEGNIIVDNYIFHENLRDLSINCADMIKLILIMTVN